MSLADFAARGLRMLDPETAHGLTIRILKTGLAGRSRVGDDPALAISLCGLDFSNPVGLAAGFDKNAEAPDAMLGLGFGFVEVGTITPLPQPGNPRPRIFRLEADRAIINRLGFNNQGLVRVVDRLRVRKNRGRPGIVGANLGANKDATDRMADYVTGLKAVSGLADYVTINISSPNTPGLRGLQDKDMLGHLLARLMETRAAMTPEGEKPQPLFLKVAPDLEPQERRDIAEISMARGIDALIVSNTTLAGRAALTSPQARETGGLSGKPLFKLSTEVLSDFYRLTHGRLPLIGVGGVASGQDAYAKIKAGASLVQLYSALTFEGPDLIQTIKRDLTAALKQDGFTHLAQAVGKDHKL